MLKANKIYTFHYADHEIDCVKVLEEFPNNFVEVWRLRGSYVLGLTRKNQFNEIFCDKQFINLNTIRVIEEVNVWDRDID
jgi:hypothetical protein